MFLVVLSITSPTASSQCSSTTRPNYLQMPCNIGSDCQGYIGVMQCSPQGAGPLGCNPHWTIEKCSDYCGLYIADSCTVGSVVTKTNVNQPNLILPSLLYVSFKVPERSTCDSTRAFDEWLTSHSIDAQRAKLNLVQSRPGG